MVISLDVLISSGAMYFTDDLSYSEGYNSFCLCRALARRGVALTVLAPSANVSMEIDGLHVVGMGDIDVSRNLRYFAFEWLKYNIKLLPKAKRILRSFEPDLVHHIFPSWIDYGYSFYPMIDRERPFIYGPILTQTDGGVSSSTSPKDRLLIFYRRTFLRKMYLQTLRRASRVIVSLDDALRYLPDFVRDKAVTICHGIDTRLFSPGMSDTEDSEFKVVFLGRLVPEKAASIAIKAISIAKKQIPNITLRIVGNGPEKATLHALAKAEGVEDSVRFLGFVNHSQIPRLLRESDILCCPSLADASPTVLLEGMACGLPIVATGIGGIPEILGHGSNGVLVRPNAPMETSEAFVRLFEDPEMARRLGKNARAEAERSFDWDVIAKKVVDLYREILD
jgi:glycosyltransferase involved in cell wall biosynthesis